jgi:hypothetical protein
MKYFSKNQTPHTKYDIQTKQPNAQPATMKHIDNRMRQALAENVFPGAVLLVAKDGTCLIHEAYGYANLRTKRILAYP